MFVSLYGYKFNNLAAICVPEERDWSAVRYANQIKVVAHKSESTCVEVGQNDSGALVLCSVQHLGINSRCIRPQVGLEVGT